MFGMVVAFKSVVKNTTASKYLETLRTIYNKATVDDIDFFGQRLNYASLSYQMTISTFPIVYNEMPFLDNANSMP